MRSHSPYPKIASLICVGLAAAILCVENAAAQSRLPVVLTGIQSVTVDYYVHSEGLPAIDTGAVRTKLELELRRIGLVVDAFTPTTNLAVLMSRPLLSFRVGVVRAGAGISFITTLVLTELSTVDRLTRPILGAIWEAKPLLVYLPTPASLHDEVIRSLQQQLDEFVNAYLTVNTPRR